MAAPSVPDAEKMGPTEADPDAIAPHYVSEGDGKADDGYEVYMATLESRKNIERTEEEKLEWQKKSKAIATKYDHWLLGAMCFLVGINYIDKAALAWAVLFGFREDLNLKGKDYSWVSSIFYFGYLAGQIPTFWLTAKFPLAKVIGSTCIAWGILMLGTLGAKNFGQIMAIRFLLGVFEAPLTPCLVAYTAMFYTKKENASRTLIWGAMQGAFYLVFSLVAYGLGKIKSHALPQWGWIFLVLGLMSIILGVVWMLLPDTPLKARFLNEEEKIVAVERTAENMYGTQGHDLKMYQVWGTLKDPMFYILMVYVFVAHVPNGISSFNTLVISSFGFNQFNTLLIGLPSSIVSAGSLITWSFLARKFGGLRTIGMSVPLIFAIIGMSTVYATSNGDYNKYGRAVAYWLINSYAVCWPFLQAHIGVNFAGHTKRSFVYGCVLLMFAAGNIVGPFVFPSGKSNYSGALAIILCFFCVQFFIAIAMRIYMIWDNKKRDKKYGPVDRRAETDGAVSGLLDKTDRENTNFRYVL